MSNLHTVEAVGVTVPTSTETVIVSSNPLTTNAPAEQGLSLRGTVNITPGTNTTAVVITVRKGVDTTGSIVDQQLTHSVTAGNPTSIPYCALDGAANLLNRQVYVVTVTQTGASANGTVNLVHLDAQDANLVE